MDKVYLEKNPLNVQRLGALRISKQKEELVSDCLRRILDAYQSAELNGCPLEMMALLHLVTLLPSDPLSDKIKAYLVEKMRITPNITSLDEITAFMLSQEADDVAKRSTQSQTRVNKIEEKDKEKEDPPKGRKYKCRICNKTHERFMCAYTCEWCHRRGHRSEGCWIKFPKLATQGSGLPVPPTNKDKREQIPASIKKHGGRNRRHSSGGRSDRGSSFERSASEPETPKDRGTRKRHRSNRIISSVNPASGTGAQNPLTGLAGSALFGPSGQSRHSHIQLFPKAQDQPTLQRRVNRVKIIEGSDELSYSGIRELFKEAPVLFDDTIELTWLFESTPNLDDGIPHQLG